MIKVAFLDDEDEVQEILGIVDTTPATTDSEYMQRLLLLHEAVKGLPVDIVIQVPVEGNFRVVTENEQLTDDDMLVLSAQVALVMNSGYAEACDWFNRTIDVHPVHENLDGIWFRVTVRKKDMFDVSVAYVLLDRKNAEFLTSYDSAKDCFYPTLCDDESISEELKADFENVMKELKKEVTSV